MSVVVTGNFEFSLVEMSSCGIVNAPVYDGAKFIIGALKASDNSHFKIRAAIQKDIARALNCNAEALSFMWAYPVKGAETLECEIPDFRDAFLELIPLKMAAE